MMYKLIYMTNITRINGDQAHEQMHRMSAQTKEHPIHLAVKSITDKAGMEAFIATYLESVRFMGPSGAEAQRVDGVRRSITAATVGMGGEVRGAWHAALDSVANQEAAQALASEVRG